MSDNFQTTSWSFIDEPEFEGLFSCDMSAARNLSGNPSFKFQNQTATTYSPAGKFVEFFQENISSYGNNNPIATKFPQKCKSRLEIIQEKILNLRESYSTVLDAKAFSKMTCAVSEILRFYACIPNEIPIPNVSVSEEGDIALEWYLGEKEVIVDFEGDGTGYYGYTLLKGDIFVPGAESGDLSKETIPSDLLLYFQN